MNTKPLTPKSLVPRSGQLTDEFIAEMEEMPEWVWNLRDKRNEVLKQATQARAYLLCLVRSFCYFTRVLAHVHVFFFSEEKNSKRVYLDSLSVFSALYDYDCLNT